MYDKIIDTYLNLDDNRYEDCLTYLDYLTNTSISNARKAQITKEYYNRYTNGGNDKTNKPISGEKKKNTKRYILIGA